MPGTEAGATGDTRVFINGEVARVHFNDGDTVNITERVAEDVGETFDVGFPQEDDYGDCEDAPPRD